MKVQIFVAVFVSYTVLTSSQSVPAAPQLEPGPILGNLTGPAGYRNHDSGVQYLGLVGNRLYFADTSVGLTWNGAKAHCEAYGLKLGSIETREQASFLITALAQFPWNTLFWISLRESRQPTMMVWDENGNQMDTSFLQHISFDTPAFQYCTVLWVQNSQILLYTDSDRGENLRSVLCHADDTASGS